MPYDLTRGGTPFLFRERQTSINTHSISPTPSNWATSCSTSASASTATTDWSRRTGRPRLGIAYNVKKTGTVLRVAYAGRLKRRSMRTFFCPAPPERAAWPKRVRFDSVPINPGFRNQFNTGFQQAIGKYPAGRRRLLLEVHPQRVRFQHAVEHDHHLSHRLAQLETGRRHRTSKHHQSSRLPGLLDLRPHPRAILLPRRRADSFPKALR